MDMWPVIQDLLVSPSSSEEIKSNVLWIIGSAVQNNPEAQNSVSGMPFAFCNRIDLCSLEVSEFARLTHIDYPLTALLE